MERRDRRTSLRSSQPLTVSRSTRARAGGRSRRRGSAAMRACAPVHARSHHSRLAHRLPGLRAPTSALGPCSARARRPHARYLLLAPACSGAAVGARARSQHRRSARHLPRLRAPTAA
eukprot:7389860-Prymnesium_polylepis.1